MIYIIILMYFLGSFMAYISLKGDNIEKSEKILWVAFWPFLTMYALCFGLGIWVYTKIKRTEVKF